MKTGTKLRLRPETLTTLRLKANMSQYDLAKKAKIPQETLNRWERGHQAPRRNNIEALAIALKCDPVILTMPPEPQKADENVRGEEKKSRIGATISPDSALDYVAIKEIYGVSPSDLIDRAPFLFAILAEMSLKWRKQKIDAAEDLAARIEEAMPGYIVGPRLSTDGAEKAIWLERSNIERRDLFGAVTDGSLQYIGSPFSKFLSEVLNDLEADQGEVGITTYSEDPFPKWHLRGDWLTKFCAGNARAVFALDKCFTTLNQIPSELRGNGDIEARAEWLASRVPDDIWESYALRLARLREMDFEELIESI